MHIFLFRLVRSAVGVLLLQAGPPVLENDYVRVTRNGAPCAEGARNECAERIVVALGPIELRRSGRVRGMERGDILVIPAGESYSPPAGGEYLEVALKPFRPPVKSPAVLIPPEKNTLLFDGRILWIFEEKLEPGETRPRHSHSQRVVIVLNETKLQQWPDGMPELIRTQVPDDVRFNEPVIHVVKNIGERALRNIVIEFKPERKRR